MSTAIITSKVDSPVHRFISYCMLEHHLKQLFSYLPSDDWTLSIGSKVMHPHTIKLQCWKYYLIHNSSMYIVFSYDDKTIETRQIH